MTIRWQLTDEIFNEVLSRPPAQREEFLAEACGTDEELRKDVESLLLYASDSESYLQTVVEETARDLHASMPCGEGARIGPYVIQREIGHGGMGTVYLAARADGQFEQKVALKVINVEFDASFALEQFLKERQVLANLQHPNIARLLDGGTTESGQPYFAMEYLEGEPLTVYLSRVRPSLPQRLEIFQQVCSAIHYAHQQLVVHRDLKPDNVIVSQEGVAKLLDFGIAKLLSEETAGVRIMTPIYASPEQFLGESSSTACDVYSLGAVLYEVISDRRPFDFHGKSPAEIEKMICSEYPRQLPGDLGYIVRMAMDKDPARRYASAEALAEDLRRYTRNVPVRAHPGGALYRTRKFVVRNRVLSAVAALLLVLILTATTLIVHEANIAWRRAGQARDLAEKLLNGFNESGDGPESTAQRAQRVRQALDSLGELSAGRRADAALDLKIAIAYEHVGDAQGDPLRRSLGDSAGAERSYRAAISILERLDRDGPPLPAVQSELLQADYRVAMLLRPSGDSKESLDYFLRAARLADAAMLKSPNDRKVEYLAGLTYDYMSRVLQGLARDKEAASANARSLTIFEKLAGVEPANQDYRQGLANCYAQRGSLANLAGKLQQGMEDFQKNLRIREALAAEFPNSVAAQRNLMLAYSRLGDVLGYPVLPNLGDAEGAVGYFRKCLDVAKSISAADPTDQVARYDVSMARLRLARTMVLTKAQDEALEILKTGTTESDRLLAADPQNKRYLGNVTTFRQLLGDQLKRTGNDQSAALEYDLSLAVADRLRARDPSEGGGWLPATAAVLISYSELAGRQGNRTRAAEIEKRAIDLAERAKTYGHEYSQGQGPLLYAALGELHAALGDAEQARSWLQKSAAGWKALQASGNLPAMHAKEPARVAALLAHLKPL